MVIRGMGTATPSRKYSQRQCWEVLRISSKFHGLNSRSQAILRKVLLGDNGISTRYLALEQLEDAFQMDPDSLHARFVRHAPELAADAARRALEDGGLNAEEISGLIISTCTGYLCPGLTSYVSERLGLRSDVVALDLVGQGCGAALPNLRMAEALIASGQCGHVLSVCVEVCSSAFYLDDDPGVLISACLFGDGAAAALVSAEPVLGKRVIRWRDAASSLSPQDRDYLRFEQRHGMLRNILSQQVPGLASKHAERVLMEVLRRQQLETSDICAWILHAGGRDVLTALSDRLKLSDEQVAGSARILREYGNLSSPFALFVLTQAIKSAQAGWWWMSSFGAGFSCHGALLQAGEPVSR